MTRIEASRVLQGFNEPLVRLSELLASGHRALPAGWDAPLARAGLQAFPGEPIEEVVDRIWVAAARVVEQIRESSAFAEVLQP